MKMSTSVLCKYYEFVFFVRDMSQQQDANLSENALTAKLDVPNSNKIRLSS